MQFIMFASNFLKKKICTRFIKKNFFLRFVKKLQKKNDNNFISDLPQNFLNIIY
jgi:hypothetical protein